MRESLNRNTDSPRTLAHRQERFPNNNDSTPNNNTTFQKNNNTVPKHLHCRKSAENRLKAGRKPAENQPEIIRPKTIRIRRVSRKPAANLPKILPMLSVGGRKPVQSRLAEGRPKTGRKPAENQPETGRKPAGNRLE